MNLCCKIFLFITLLFGPAILKAQSYIRLTDTLINELRRSSGEPIIRFSIPTLYIHPVLKYESDSGREYAVSLMEYLIFKKGGETYSRKIVGHDFEDGTNVHVSVSESIIFDNRIYHWLTSNISAIQNEKILPFEYYNLYEDKLVTLRSSHPVTIEIGIYSSQETFE